MGTNLFRSLFLVDRRKRETDAFRDGELSCAAVVTGVLVLHGFLPKPRATVSSAVEDLRAHGWRRIRIPKTGCVLHWEAVEGRDGKAHEHLGFYAGNRRAVSNSSARRRPILHHWTYGVRGGKPVRAVLGMYWHDALDA